MSNEQLKNNLIDKITSLNDQGLLHDLHRIVDELQLKLSGNELSEEVISMLKKSDNDIKSGRLITEEDIQKEEDQCLKE